MKWFRKLGYAAVFAVGMLMATPEHATAQHGKGQFWYPSNWPYARQSNGPIYVPASEVSNPYGTMGYPYGAMGFITPNYGPNVGFYISNWRQPDAYWFSGPLYPSYADAMNGVTDSAVYRVYPLRVSNRR